MVSRDKGKGIEERAIPWFKGDDVMLSTSQTAPVSNARATLDRQPSYSNNALPLSPAKSSTLIFPGPPKSKIILPLLGCVVALIYPTSELSHRSSVLEEQPATVLANIP